jgi:hypothetical protein
MTIRLAVRGFIAGVRQFEEFVQVPENRIDLEVPELASKHAAALVGALPFMIEIEFLDEPDFSSRFFRFGTDKSGMVLPLEV